jgi:hypothetical protein
MIMDTLKGSEIILGIFSLVVGAAVAYLRLYVGSVMKSQTIDLTNIITTQINEIRKDMYSREMTDAKIQLLESRISLLEKKGN